MTAAAAVHPGTGIPTRSQTAAPAVSFPPPHHAVPHMPPPHPLRLHGFQFSPMHTTHTHTHTNTHIHTHTHTHTLPTQAAGYNTYLVGKLLNGFTQDAAAKLGCPRGWTSLGERRGSGVGLGMQQWAV